MDIEIVQFHPRHMELMQLRDIEKDGVFKLKDAYDRIDKIAKDSVQAATFVYDGRVIFCGGFSERYPGFFEVWMISSEHVKTLPVRCARTIKRYLDRIMEDFSTNRMQTTTYDDSMHRRWMKFLGFKLETPDGMKNFTHDGKTMLLFSRTR